MKGLVQLMRPTQWVKNLFCFLPLFFSGNVLNAHLVVLTLMALGAFCAISSSIYCLNDIRDVEADRQHPAKCKRPVASGAVSVGTAYAFMGVLVALAFGFAWLLPEGSQRIGVMCVVGFYFLMNVAYCLKLKQMPLIDVTIISIGFVLRVVVGGIACNIMITHWIVIMTFLLALFLALCKRRDDVVIFEETGVEMRKNINRYNADFMNQAITIVATITLVAYVMYTVSAEVMDRFHSSYLYITSVFVLLGIMRFLQLTLVDRHSSGSPTQVVLHDRFVQACVVGWVVTFAVLIYL